MGYTTLVRTVRYTYRVWDSDMVRGQELPARIGTVMYGLLDREQCNELDKFAECELTEMQINNLETLIRGY